MSQRLRVKVSSSQLAHGDKPLGPVGDLYDDTERKPLDNPPRQLAPHTDALGERLEGIGPRGPERQPGLPVPCVELEELAGDALARLNDFRRVVETPPAQLRQREEPDPREAGVRETFVQGDERPERLDGRDGTGKQVPLP